MPRGKVMYVLQFVVVCDLTSAVQWLDKLLRNFMKNILLDFYEIQIFIHIDS
jgi:hypothetical protein